MTCFSSGVHDAPGSAFLSPASEVDFSGSVVIFLEVNVGMTILRVEDAEFRVAQFVFGA
jgi:hypothetical protein